MNTPASAAVIDVGSNSIKLLVARRETDGGLKALLTKTIDARISTGISHESPQLGDAGMKRGLAVIRELLADAATFSPDKTVLVSTSAVRDAANGDEFRRHVFAETGQTLRTLTGTEEANLIGRGLLCDPALAHLQDFYVFDLGGGSLECLAFHDRIISQAVSLQLGCVRLTERYVVDPSQPFSSAAQRSISELSKEVFAKSGFRFDLSPDAAVVGTGGTITTARAILAARRGKTLEASDTIVTIDEFRELLAHVGHFGLEERRRIPAMPAARADILPAALATIIAVAEIGGFGAVRNSLYNLRWGVAAEALTG